MPSNESFDTLVRELSAEVSAQVKSQVENNIGSLVSQRIAELVTTDMLSRFIVNRIDQRINEFMPDTSAFDNKVADASLMIVNQIQAKANQFVDDTLKSRLGSLDIHGLAREHISNFLASMNTRFFPDNFIPGHAIDKSGFMISGNNINGGIIKNFSSVGIDDRSSSCKMTVLDQGVVMEDTLYAPRIEIKGDAVIDGDIMIKGKIPESSPAFQDLVRDSAAMVKQMVAPEIISTFQVSVFDRIKNEGIEVDNLSVNGQKLIDGRKLSYGIVDSNLQSVGILRDLQTQGENLLSETLYVTKNRVGINTMDPVTALSIWDEEIELYIGKQKQNTARISAQRGNNLIVGSNSQDNIICTPDGNVQVKQIKVGNINISSSATPPSYDAPSGSIVLNENPGIGGPIGWVSLGHARWANFGIID
jgi:hypothetical protein